MNRMNHILPIPSKPKAGIQSYADVMGISFNMALNRFYDIGRIAQRKCLEARTPTRQMERIHGSTGVFAKNEEEVKTANAFLELRNIIKDALVMIEAYDWRTSIDTKVRFEDKKWKSMNKEAKKRKITTRIYILEMVHVGFLTMIKLHELEEQFSTAVATDQINGTNFGDYAQVQNTIKLIMGIMAEVDGPKLDAFEAAKQDYIESLKKNQKETLKIEN